jgi:AbrB family looped-hinge helix DNA binding protein
MKEFLSSVSTKGQVTLPAEIRARLGIKPKDTVILSLEDEGVILRPTQVSLKAGFRSIPALKPSRSLEEMTEMAAEEHAEEAAKEGLAKR